MSRTFKDRPDWVKKNDLAYRPFIQHNHTKGECIEETFEELRRFAGGQVDWKISSQHGRGCKKRNYYTEYCTKDTPHTGYFSRCWTPALDWGGTYLISCPGRETYTVDPDIPCSCDRHPEPTRTTCYISIPRSISPNEIYKGGPSRSDRVNIFGTRPERARVRDSLRGMVDDYNTNGDLSDENEDFVTGYYKPRGWFWCC